MKLKKLILLLLIGTLFVGCQQSKEIDEYKGLKAQETFEKVVNKMDKEIHYVHVVSENSETKYDQELYMIDGKIHSFQKTEIKADKKYSFNLATADKNYYLFDTYGTMKLMELERQPLPSTYLNNPFQNKELKIIDTKRKDNDDGIILTVRYSYYEKIYDENGQSKNGEICYMDLQIMINNQGLIEKEVNTLYTDDTFQTKREDALTTTTTFLDYNKKSQNDFNKIVETVEKSEGVLYEDFVKSLEQ